jgi:hypothetical protein
LESQDSELGAEQINAALPRSARSKNSIEQESTMRPKKAARLAQ